MKIYTFPLQKTAMALVLLLLAGVPMLQGSGLEGWRLRDWTQSTVREFVAFSTSADLKNALGAPDEERGTTWVYSEVMVTNPDGGKSPQKLVISFEGANAESKVTGVSLEAMDKLTKTNTLEAR
ncbi:MAG: hypothetical protein NTV93_09225 [Verrucomicrobia bacterium]|nr:hypothetical protein [Verrucomicrobiota bacterium]